MPLTGYFNPRPQLQAPVSNISGVAPPGAPSSSNVNQGMTPGGQVTAPFSGRAVSPNFGFQLRR